MSGEHNRRRGIITGAGSGLGRALSVRFAQQGYELALVDVNDETNAETAELVAKAGGRARLEHVDVGQREAWQDLHDRLQAEWPQLDLLINNAGVAGAGEVGRFTLDDWQWLLDVNLWGVIYGCHTFVPWLKSNPAGARLVNIASLAGFLAPPLMGAYNVSKAGVMALSETLYGELKPAGVHVTVVCPGFFDSNLFGGGRYVRQDFVEWVEQKIRDDAVSPDDVAAAVVQGVERGKLYVVPGAARRYWWLKRFSPERICRYLVRRVEQAGLTPPK